MKGRPSPIAPLVFLVTRWPLLVGWIVGATAFAFYLSQAPAAHGKAIDLPLLVGVSLVSGGGFAALTVGTMFALVRVLSTPPRVRLREGESVVRELAANHFLRGEARGGKLMVTSERLAFRPHRFNVQLATWSVPLDAIRAVSADGERFVVVESDGGDDWLVVWSPSLVVEQIREAAAARKGAMVNA